MINIFIAAHYNMNNGDRAVLEATLEKIINLEYEIDVTVSVANPEAKIKDSRFKVVGWPLKNKKIYKALFGILTKINNITLLKMFYRIYVSQDYLNALKKSDIVLIVGGHHLTDILGEKNFYNLASNFLIPIFEKKKIFLMPQSLGPVNDLKMKKITKYILNNVQEVVYRDNSSKIFLDELIINTNYKYVPDIVYSLPGGTIKKNNNEIGIALYCSYVGEKREKLMPWVIENLIGVINEYAKKGFKFSIISMDPNDLKVAKKIVEICNKENTTEVVRIEKPKTDYIGDIINLFSNKRMVLAYKTHSVIFSLINAVPVIAIAYHPKSIEFMVKVDLKNYAINDNKADKENLSILINDALQNSDEIIETEKTGVERNVELIDAYIHNIFES